MKEEYAVKKRKEKKRHKNTKHKSSSMRKTKKATAHTYLHEISK